MAVVHQLRARHAQARRGAAEGAAGRRPLRPGCATRRDRTAHQARLHRHAEQPDGDDDDALAARLLLRPRARACAHRPRSGLLRVHRAPGLPGRRRGVPEGGPAGARAPHLLEDLRACRAAGRLRGRADGRDRSDREDAAGVRRQHPGPGRRPREHRRAGGARRAPAARPTKDGSSSSARCGSTGSSRRGLRSRTSSSWKWGRTRGRSTKRCSGRARSCARWVDSGRRERCGSPSGLRTRTRSSPKPWPRFWPRRPRPSGILRHPRVRSGPRFPYADNVEKRHRSRCDHRSQWTARAAARGALADHRLPPAGSAKAFGLGDSSGRPLAGRSSPCSSRSARSRAASICSVERSHRISSRTPPT